MPPVFFLQFITLSLRVLEGSAATDTISPGRALVGGSGRIVSGNGKFALGFFQATGSDPSLPPNAPNPWYLGMWYSQVPKITPVWVANRDDPLTDAGSWQLAISGDGNLVISSLTKNSTIWSSRANITTNDTVAVLLNNGNLVLREASNSSNVLWQSFDHPTDTLLSGAKLGRNKVTGLNRRLVSRRNRVSQATGAYYLEVDPGGSGQLILAPLNSSSSPYWYSGPWNGKYFSSVSEMQSGRANFTYVNNEQEEYFMFTLSEADENMYILRDVLDISGQTKALVWGFGGLPDWIDTFSLPSAQCDVYAICGAFTNCEENSPSFCSCMKGFSVKSPKDWELQDHSGGCMRNLPLDCGATNKSIVADFGMAKFLGRDFSRALTTMRGTVGYLAPEWISGTAITSKVDVYSYGMVLLEIISGKRNSSKQSYSNDGDHADYFPVQVVHKLHDLDVASLVDENLQGDVNLMEVERLCKVACWCIQDSEFDRPTMVEVVQFLEGILEPDMPPMPRLLHAIAAGSHYT